MIANVTTAIRSVNRVFFMQYSPIQETIILKMLFFHEHHKGGSVDALRLNCKMILR